MVLKDHVQSRRPYPGPEFVKADRATNITKHTSYIMRIYATRDVTCVRRESSGVKARGRGLIEAQEWFFVTDLTAEGWCATFAEAVELAERRKRKRVSASLLRTKDHSKRRSS